MCKCCNVSFNRFIMNIHNNKKTELCGTGVKNSYLFRGQTFAYISQ